MELKIKKLFAHDSTNWYSVFKQDITPEIAVGTWRAASPQNRSDATQSAASPQNQSDATQSAVSPQNQSDATQSAASPQNQPQCINPNDLKSIEYVTRKEITTRQMA